MRVVPEKVGYLTYMERYPSETSQIHLRWPSIFTNIYIRCNKERDFLFKDEEN